MDEIRLRQILDAYGARPERWPEAERAAARALLASSPAARAAQADAARLDALLDAAPAPPAPPAELAARIVAAARPRARVVSLRRAAAVVVPLAAAAGLVLWLQHRAPSPGRASAADLALAARLDDVATPSDDLLDTSDAWAADTTPTWGCATGELGCPDLPTATGRQSRRTTERIPV